MQKKILVFSNGEKIGDGIIKLPFVHEIKRRLPDYQIYWMTNEGDTVYNNRLKNITDKYFEKIYVAARLQPFFWKKISYKYDLQHIKFDYIIDTQKAFLRTLALKRIKNDIFISSTALGFFSNKKIINKEKIRKYYLEDLFDLLNLIKSDDIDRNFKFEIPRRLDELLQKIFNKKFRYIGYAPGAGESNKIWNINNFIEVIKYFENNSFKSVFFLGPDDNEIKIKLKKLFPNAIYPEERNINFSGPEIVMSSTKYLSIALSNDSGVSHMLSTNYCPLLKLFGPKDSLKFTPNKNLIKTLSSKDFNSSDINSITIEMVINSMKKLLKES